VVSTRSSAGLAAGSNLGLATSRTAVRWRRRSSATWRATRSNPTAVPRLPSSASPWSVGNGAGRPDTRRTNVRNAGRPARWTGRASLLPGVRKRGRHRQPRPFSVRRVRSGHHPLGRRHSYHPPRRVVQPADSRAEAVV